MRKFTYLSSIIFVSLLLICCDGIFIYDPIDPRLPKYSEDGNDVAGAFINGEVWTSIVKRKYFTDQYFNYPVISLYERTDSLIISFEGESIDWNIIEFRLSDIHIHRFEDLILLKNKKIQLDGVKNYAICVNRDQYRDDFRSKKTPGIGQLYIKNVNTNGFANYITLSGTFGFVVNDSVYGKVEVSYGRFDYDFSRFSNYKFYEEPTSNSDR
jgi:hypothetical protein